MSEEREPACPHCGSANGYTRCVYVSGYELYEGDWADTSERFVDNERVRYRDAAFVQCVTCGKSSRRPPDPEHLNLPVVSSPERPND